MRFQFRSIGQVDGMRRDIVNGGPSIVAGRRAGCETSCIAKNAIFRRRIGKDRPRRLKRAKKLLEKRAVISKRVWGAVLLYGCGNRRPDVGSGLWLSSDPNWAGRGIGKGALLPSWRTASIGIGRTFSGSAIAAEGAGGIDPRFDSSGKLCASETGVELEENLGSNSAP
jgi:hypothetical protein